MKYLVIAAMQEEADAILKEVAGMENVKVVTSGIGKVNAAITTTKEILEFRPDHVINTGSAGSVCQELNIGDVVIANNCVYHDVDVTHFGYEIGQVPQMEKEISCFVPEQVHGAIVGQVVSGDQFVDFAQVQKIHSQFPKAKCVEMEATAIAHTCLKLGVKCTIVRSISDNPFKENNKVDFKEFLHIAAKNSASIVKQIIG